MQIHRLFRRGAALALGAGLTLSLLCGCSLLDELRTGSNDLFRGEPVTRQQVELEGKYGRSQLDGLQRELYDDLYSAVSRAEDSIQVDSRITVEELETVYRYYFSDSPEHFWVDGYSYVTGPGGRVQKVLLRYIGTREEIARMDGELEQRVEELTAQGAALPGDFEKSVWVSDELARWVRYDTDLSGKSPYTAYGALVDGRAVCQGYAKAAQLLYQRLGYPCLYVRGESRGERHGWVMVKLGESYYHVDPTWNDLYMEGMGEDEVILNHSYQNITTAAISRDHQISGEENYPLPPADSTEMNYYRVKGLQGADFGGIAERVIAAAAENIGQGDYSVEMQLGDAQAIQSAAESIGGMRRLISGVNEALGREAVAYRYSYYQNPDQFTLQIYFEKVAS